MYATTATTTHLQASDVNFRGINGAAYAGNWLTDRAEPVPTEDTFVLYTSQDNEGPLVAIHGGFDEVRAFVRRLAGAVGLQVIEPEVHPSTIDLEAVVARVKELLPDVQCYVEQTGGGIATIYCGEPYVVSAPTPSDPDSVDRAVPVMAGPGWFEGSAWTKGRATLDDFYAGYDENYEPDLHDRTVSSWVHDDGSYFPIEEIAEVIVTLYRAHPRINA